MRYRRLLLFLLTIFPSLGLEAETQPRASYLDQPGEVREVGNVLPGKTYPLIIFLPFTTGSGSRFFEAVAATIPLDTYIALIPRGVAQRQDYLPDFISYVRWYEERIQKDIAVLRDQGQVDEERIYLAGFSLGGDLAWAFMMKQPGVFRGGLIMGSRCSYPASVPTLQNLKALGRRLVFQIHQGDDSARVRGMASAAARIKEAGITTRHFQTPGGGHGLPVPEVLEEAWSSLLPNP